MLKIARFAAFLTIICSQHAVAETGVTKDAILLGQSVALSGAAAQLGIQMRNGMKAYFDHVNEHGGVHGRKIELITLDDGYEPARTVPNAKKLIEEHKVFALIGYVGTPTSLAAIPRTRLMAPNATPTTHSVSRSIRQPARSCGCSAWSAGPSIASSPSARGCTSSNTRRPDCASGLSSGACS